MKTHPTTHDLFNHIDQLPTKVQSLLSRECESYQDCEQLTAELNELGYTMDYDLDAVGYNLREVEPTPEHYRDTLKAQGYGPTIGNHGLIFVHPPGGFKRSFISYEEAYKHYNN